MLKLLFLLLVLSVAAFGGYIINSYDFILSGQVGGYFVEVSAAFLAGSILVILTGLYGVIRFLWWVRTSPSRIASRLKKDKQAKAYKQIMEGFSLLASGESTEALKLANKISKTLPGERIVTMLQAQSAATSGQRELAGEYYRELSLHEESRFIGVRGLIADSIQKGQVREAIGVAENLLKESPKSKWLNEAVIDLAFKLQDWDRLERYLKKAEANKAIEKKALKSRFAVFYFIKAQTARRENRFEDANWLAARSLKYDANFLPGILLYGQILLGEGEFSKLRKLVQDAWPENPHPELGAFYERAIAEYKPAKQLKLADELYHKNPSDYESVMFYAKMLIAAGKSAEAADMLKKAASFRTTRGICRLMALIDDTTTWNKRAETAADDKCWYCTKTGARYSTWQIFSDSGEFNTIVWGFAPKFDTNISNQFLAVI